MKGKRWGAVQPLSGDSDVAFPGARFALSGLAVVGDVDLEAAQRQVPTETLEFDLAVPMGSAGTDGRVAQLVQVPGWAVLLPHV